MRLGRYSLALGLSFCAVTTSAFAVEGHSSYDQEGKHHFVPQAGFVPDEATAIRIAEAVWTPIYGQSIQEERPFRAKLINGVWHVEGSLPEGWRLGGTPEAEIAKADGKILRVSHGK